AETALRLRPNNDQALWRVTRALQESGQYTAAIRSYGEWQNPSGYRFIVFAARFLYSALIFRSIPDADPLPYLEAWQASPLADGESLLMLASTHVYRGDT